MADIPCIYPVEKCPQRTYTYSLKGTYRVLVGGIGFFLLFALLMAAFLFILVLLNHHCTEFVHLKRLVVKADPFLDEDNGSGTAQFDGYR